MDDESYRRWLWLCFVAFIAAAVGYKRKQYPQDIGKPLWKVLGNLALSVVSSMTIAVVAYMLALAQGINAELAVALAGMMSFTGTDFLVFIEKVIFTESKALVAELAAKVKRWLS